MRMRRTAGSFPAVRSEARPVSVGPTVAVAVRPDTASLLHRLPIARHVVLYLEAMASSSELGLSNALGAPSLSAAAWFRGRRRSWMLPQ